MRLLASASASVHFLLSTIIFHSFVIKSSSFAFLSNKQSANKISCERISQSYGDHRHYQMKQSFEEFHSSIESVSTNPKDTGAFNLILDSRVTKVNYSGENDTEKYLSMDTALVTDLLVEVYGAVTVIATKIEDTDSSRAGELYDEPDVEYNASESLELLPKDIPSASRKKRQLWSNAQIVARFSFDEDLNISTDANEKAKTIVEGLKDILFEDAQNLVFDYRVEKIDIKEEGKVDWVEKVQSSWPPSVLTTGICPIIASLTFHTDQDCQDVLKDSTTSYERIILEGGSAFGTGDHPTAKLCAQWLLENCRFKKTQGSEQIKLLDYGSGSG